MSAADATDWVRCLACGEARFLGNDPLARCDRHPLGYEPAASPAQEATPPREMCRAHALYYTEDGRCPVCGPAEYDGECSLHMDKPVASCRVCYRAAPTPEASAPEQMHAYWMARLAKYENDEGACCPEDVGFVEYIASLRATVAALTAERTQDTERLLTDALEMANGRGWAMEWPDRYANLVLEASEFTEAWRGKHGDPVKEAGDVLLTYLLALGAAGVSWADAFAACSAKVAEFRTRAPYHGEFTADHRTAARAAPRADSAP